MMKYLLCLLRDKDYEELPIDTQTHQTEGLCCLATESAGGIKEQFYTPGNTQGLHIGHVCERERGCGLPQDRLSLVE